MKKLTIAIQDNLTELKSALEERGHATTSTKNGAKDATIHIISGIDMAYEEMQPIEYMGNAIIINAGHISNDKILDFIDQRSAITGFKIAVDDRLTSIKKALEDEGHAVYSTKTMEKDIRISIIKGFDMAYEEMQPIEYINDKAIVINASALSEDKIIDFIRKQHK